MPSTSRSTGWLRLLGLAILLIPVVGGIVWWLDQGRGEDPASDEPAVIDRVIAEARRLRESGQPDEARIVLRRKIASIGALSSEEARVRLFEELGLPEEPEDETERPGAGFPLWR